ncbi:MAG TPA: HNH endonuclease domain-containing protein [Bacteroidales bacterium]|nr:HNH endonuclease domain-containing protein [Bacteroidales bacterium]
MESNYLNKLSKEERRKLIEKLWAIQHGKCFISEDDIDLNIHYDNLDIDHVIPKSLGGKDDPSNFALTFASANRAKQASDLNLARILFRFKKIQENIKTIEDRSPNLNDIFQSKNGSKFKIKFKKTKNSISYSLSEIGDNSIYSVPVYFDKLSKLNYFFVVLPIEFLFHDDKINPRTIGPNISSLISEFYIGNPQLHISLAWIELNDDNKSQVKIFDGQHKAAAQVMLDIRLIPVRIFINPNIDKLILTNFRAGTVLKQIAFDKSVQRLLGSTMFGDRVKRYQIELGLGEENLDFSEKTLANYYKGEREIKRYIIDATRSAITQNPENKLMDYVDLGGRAKEKPISYSTIEKTFYSFLIFQELLDIPISYKLEEGKNPRTLEKEQIVKLMNLIAEIIFINKFDFSIGTSLIENKIQKGETIPFEHVRAFRMAKEEVIYNWLKFIPHIIQSYFFQLNGTMPESNKVFQMEFSEQLWIHIENYLINLSELPVWANNTLSSTVFGGKQNMSFWEAIFATGKTPQGFQVLVKPINILELQTPRNK